MALDLERIRAQFPALRSGDLFLDNPGGTQVPDSVVEATVEYLRSRNANVGGAFATSRATDETIEAARSAMADMLGCQPREVVFGANMTTLTFALSRALGRRLERGDELVVTLLDHDANVAPWVEIARDRGCTVRTVEFDRNDCTLDLEQLKAALCERTRLVAIGYAANAVGTVNPVREIVDRTHEVGGVCFVDAVQYAPHGLIDVAALGCDFLAVSAYKFFGPHVGVLYGRYDLLSELEPERVRPASDAPPESFETGTRNHEGLAGVVAAVDYLASVSGVAASRPRRERLVESMTCIAEHDSELACHLVSVLQTVPGLVIYGLTDPSRASERVSTVAFRLADRGPREVAEALGRRGIYVWDGDYYAIDVVERLGFADSGGLVRVGAVHYNTKQEIDRLGAALMELVG